MPITPSVIETQGTHRVSEASTVTTPVKQIIVEKLIVDGNVREIRRYIISHSETDQALVKSLAEFDDDFKIMKSGGPKQQEVDSKQCNKVTLQSGEAPKRETAHNLNSEANITVQSTEAPKTETADNLNSEANITVQSTEAPKTETADHLNLEENMNNVAQENDSISNNTDRLKIPPVSHSNSLSSVCSSSEGKLNEIENINTNILADTPKVKDSII